MSLLSRLFTRPRDDCARVRPLWRRIVKITREVGWYEKGGVADSVAGRFDVLTAIMALVLLRMEHGDGLREPSARLTELFVSDIDGQLRESGVGDVVMGKRMGKLMGVLGGRIDAYRIGLGQSDDAALIEAVRRNFTLEDQADPAHIAAEMRYMAVRLDALDAARLLAGEVAR